MGISISLILSVFAMFSSAVANTSDEPGTGSVTLDNLIACQQLTDTFERARCLDARLTDFKTALDNGSIVVVERETIRAVEKESFGLGLPSVGGMIGALRPRPSDDDNAPLERVVEEQADGSIVTYGVEGEIEEIEGLPVRSVETNRVDLMVVTLGNGQVWRQTRASNVRVPRHHEREGLTAEIRSGAFGAYFMTLSHSSRDFRVERID